MKEAYEAFGPAMETVTDYNEIMNDYRGRIWIVTRATNIDVIYKVLSDNVTVKKNVRFFKTRYKDLAYIVILVEKH